MKSGRECFEAWAGDHEWSDWTKPTLFASELFRSFASVGPQSLPDTADGALELALRNVVRFGSAGGNRACVVVDLPGERALQVGAALTEHGFAPVVLFNGVASARNPVIAHDESLKALIRYSAALRMAQEPSPAFLLDSRRMQGTPAPGRYDNRWVTFPQDFPSAGLLRMRGVKRCYLLLDSDRVADDLAHVLKRWQDAGIEMLGAHDGRPVTVQRPPLYKALYYRWSALVGLKPNSFGGFGASIPEVTSRGYVGGFG
jgi:hypothetical protein